MTALKIILGALLGTVVGWVVAAAGTMLLGGLFGLTEFEGQRSMTAIFGVGPAGGFAGLLIGLGLGLRASRVQARD